MRTVRFCPEQAEKAPVRSGAWLQAAYPGPAAIAGYKPVDDYDKSTYSSLSTWSQPGRSFSTASMADGAPSTLTIPFCATSFMSPAMALK